PYTTLFRSCCKGKTITTEHDEATAKPKLTKSQSNRMSQTAKAMTYSVLATLAIVLGWMALNPQADNEFDPGVDVAAAEQEVAKVAPVVAATVNAPYTWRANYAHGNLGEQHNIASLQAGYLTEDEEFFGISQTSYATAGWVDDQVNAVGEATETTVANHDVTRWIGEDEHIYLVAELEQQAN